RRAARIGVVRVVALQIDFVGIDLNGFDVAAGGEIDRAVFAGLYRYALWNLLPLLVRRHDLDPEISPAEIGDGPFYPVGRVLRLADGEVRQRHGVDPVVEKLVDEFAVGARGDQVLFEVRASRELAEGRCLLPPTPLLSELPLLQRRPPGQAERVYTA